MLIYRQNEGYTMSIIGDALLTKISDEKKKKYHYYADYVRCNSSDKAVKYSYLDLYNLVEYVF